MTLWTEARQAPLSMEFSRQEYWIKPVSPAAPELQADYLSLSHPGSQLQAFLEIKDLEQVVTLVSQKSQFPPSSKVLIIHEHKAFPLHPGPGSEVIHSSAQEQL